MKAILPLVNPLPSIQPALAPTAPDPLESLYDVCADSNNLIASRHHVTFSGGSCEVPRFLFLGQRGGGHPIRVALFAGFDANASETTIALSRLLLQLEINPALAKDYALFAYPVVNPAAAHQVHEEEATIPADLGFFRSELQNWAFDGILQLRASADASGFHATTRSKVLGVEVVQPALNSISHSLPVQEHPVEIRPDDRESRLQDISEGKLTPPAEVRPYPFEIELFAPTSLSPEQQVTGLFLIVQEILRQYRRVISHAQHL